MAAAMEQAFFEAWPDFMDEQPAPDPNPQMKLMFVAIARGVVRHLTEHPEAFQLTVNAAGNHNHSVGGVGNTSSNGSHTHSVTVDIEGD